MLRPRLIPTLLLKQDSLVKTVKFAGNKYVGDPLNAVRIFNEKGVDELFIIDIDATTGRQKPNFALLERIASQCRMPLCYGGGVKSLDDFHKLVGLGVEKVAISSEAIKNPSLIAEAASQIGSQSVVVVLDIKKTGLFGKSYTLTSHNAKINHKLNITKYIEQIQSYGAGEIVISSVDNDGTFAGYDLELIDRLKPHIKIPLTVLGGASSLSSVSELYSRFGIVGAAAGSIFVFKGKYRAVLIQYPDITTKNLLFPPETIGNTL